MCRFAVTAGKKKVGQLKLKQGGEKNFDAEQPKLTIICILSRRQSDTMERSVKRPKAGALGPPKKALPGLFAPFRVGRHPEVLLTPSEKNANVSLSRLSALFLQQLSRLHRQPSAKLQCKSQLRSAERFRHTTTNEVSTLSLSHGVRPQEILRRQ
jgi:hypothetical protein